jgi:hypothetical protein
MVAAVASDWANPAQPRRVAVTSKCRSSKLPRSLKRAPLRARPTRMSSSFFTTARSITMMPRTNNNQIVFLCSFAATCSPTDARTSSPTISCHLAQPSSSRHGKRFECGSTRLRLSDGTIQGFPDFASSLEFYLCSIDFVLHFDSSHFGRLSTPARNAVSAAHRDFLEIYGLTA